MKKLSLRDIKIQSFVTAIDKKKRVEARGGLNPTCVHPCSYPDNPCIAF